MQTRYNALEQPDAAAAAASPPSNTTPSAPQAKPASRKVSFGNIAAKKPDGPAEGIFPDPDAKAAGIAGRIAERDAQFDALKSALETDKAELGQVLVRPWFLQAYHGKTDVPSSVLVRHANGAVRVSVKEAYNTVPEDALRSLLGEAFEAWFRQAFELKIDGDKLPLENCQAFIDELQALAARFNCLEALTFKEVMKPIPDFKSKRFREMPLDLSLALERLGDKGLTQVAISAKTRR